MMTDLGVTYKGKPIVQVNYKEELDINCDAYLVYKDTIYYRGKKVGVFEDNKLLFVFKPEKKNGKEIKVKGNEWDKALSAVDEYINEMLRRKL